MIAVVPTFLSQAGPPWGAEQGPEMLAPVLDHLLATPAVSQVVVPTDCEWVLGLARDRIEIRLSEPWPEESADPAPTAFRRLPPPDALTSLGINLDAPVLFMDHANPLLGPRTIALALDRYFSSGLSALLSVVASVDHPCQLKALFAKQPSDLRLVVFLEPGWTTAGDWGVRYRATKPVPGAFKVFGGAPQGSPTGLFRREFDWLLRRHVMRPVCRPSDTVPGEPLWQAQGGSGLRLLLPETFFGNPTEATQAAAVAPFSWPGPATVGRLEPGRGLCLLPERLFGRHATGRTRFRLVEVTGEAQGAAFEIELPENHDSLPLAPPPGDALIFQMAEVAQDQCRHAELFPPAQGLWRLDTLGRAVRSDTGEFIQGRQQFPEVYELDGSLLVIRPVDLPRLPALLDCGQVGYVELPRSQSVHVRSPLDRLRCLAKINAAGR